MDLQAEQICKEEMKSDPRRFLLLFEDSFSDLYRYVARRVEDETIREQVVKLVYLDAIGQMQTCSFSISFMTWLYGLAKKRVSEYVKGSVVGAGVKIESPIFEGASMVNGVYDDEFKLRQQADTFFSSLTFEEREIIKLKFFEELTDGEVMYVLGLGEGVVGAKIYQVLKRGYEILFGEVMDNSGVYYGELHSFLSRLREMEKIPVSDTFRLKLKTEITNKLDKMYRGKFDGGVDEVSGETSGGTQKDPFGTGSKDPAKTFVYAAKEMSKDEIDNVTEEYVSKKESVLEAELEAEAPEADDFEREISVEEFVGLDEKINVEEDVPVHHVEDQEVEDVLKKSLFVDKVLDFWERWKSVMSLVPTTMFVAAVVVVVGIVVFGRIEDDGVTGLPFKVDYGIGFKDAVSEDPESVSDYDEKIVIEETLISEIAEGKEIRYVEVWRMEGGLNMEFKLDDGGLRYLFGELGDEYRVEEFRKI